MKAVVIITLVSAYCAQSASPLDSCTCYCCPGKTSPYGIQPDCDMKTPPYAGIYAIGDPVGCTAVGCNVNYGLVCPSSPLIGFKNESGAIRYGCNSGCRFKSDGVTIQNASSDSGIVFGSSTSDAVVCKSLVSTIVIFMMSRVL